MIYYNQELSLQEIESLLFTNEKIALSPKAEKRVESSYQFLKEFSQGKVIYGINTGFGPMAQYRVSDETLSELQYNIIRSHATGAGEPLSDLQVKAAMIARLGTLVQGYSGIHLSVLQLLVEFINRGIYPLIPRHGSVGASGDLVQLAHLGLTLIGEGKVHYKGEWRDTAGVLKENNLSPVSMFIREGLCITNGTSVMTGIGLINAINAKKLLNWSIISSALVNEVASSYDDFLAGELNGAKRQTGQRRVAAIMSKILESSRNMQKRTAVLYNKELNGDKIFKQKVQPFYSLRCVPQILGPVMDTLQVCERILVDELNTACDNPIIDVSSGNVYHGGNFHGDYISLEMDKMKIVLTRLTMLAERQMNYIFHDKVNGMLPPFVNMGVLGLNYGLQASQFTATSTTAECQTLSMPNYVHSIPNNNDNQDIVSMGTNSALITATVIENAFQVMAIHFMAIVQAVDCLGIKDRLSDLTKEIYDDIREFVPVFVQDTPKYETIAQMVEYLNRKKTSL